LIWEGAGKVTLATAAFSSENGAAKSEASDRAFMRKALQEAVAAFHKGEVPVGAIVVLGGRVLASAHNLCEGLCDPTAHAEILALREACSVVGSYRLEGACVYVTVEPCVMCAGALHAARVDRVVYGCTDPKGGAMGSLYSIHLDGKLNHRVEVSSGVLGGECGRLMRSFFRRLRARQGSERGARRRDGRVWLKAADSKSVVHLQVDRGFESLSLRHWS
jgi:tRNA(adenine34) deaminase